MNSLLLGIGAWVKAHVVASIVIGTVVVGGAIATPTIIIPYVEEQQAIKQVDSNKDIKLYNEIKDKDIIEMTLDEIIMLIVNMPCEQFIEYANNNKINGTVLTEQQLFYMSSLGELSEKEEQIIIDSQSTCLEHSARKYSCEYNGQPTECDQTYEKINDSRKQFEEDTEDTNKAIYCPNPDPFSGNEENRKYIAEGISRVRSGLWQYKGKQENRHYYGREYEVCDNEGQCTLINEGFSPDILINFTPLTLEGYLQQLQKDYSECMAG